MAEQLWAPWRLEYIKSTPRKEECFLCDYPRQQQDEPLLILGRNDAGFCIMNKYPYNNGHLLIAPYRHIAQPEKLSDHEWLSLWQLQKTALQALQGTMNPHGFNIGMNVGRVAGAGLDEHVHIHIVPRWNGDTNFMPVLADCKVISEHLEMTYKKLLPFFAII
jgi:ATP adenylyltransferase